MDIKRDVGIGLDKNDPAVRDRFIRYINLKLTSLGLPIYEKADHQDIELAHDLISTYREKDLLLKDHLSPVDTRIQNFLDAYLKDSGIGEVPRLPSKTFVLDRYGIARELSLPPDQDKFVTDIVNSYRVKQGVVNNPKNDRRTTKGSFHVAEGGLPIPLDKKAVPKLAFARLLEKAFADAPKELMQLPFTASQGNKAETFVTLLLRPTVSPKVEGVIEEKVMEVRFFAPGNLVSNLDFVESIFGNAGDPHLAENDSALDPMHWSGHTGCVILAPHLVRVKKKDLGLPHYDHASERQRKDGMCWKNDDELYNDGTPYKLTCRDERGVIVTIIADNYYGYSKKEVKTQLGYAANLMGLAEEEHAGGAMAFPSYNHGEKFIPDSNLNSKGHNFAAVVKNMGDAIDVKPEGYAVDKTYPSIIYIPEDATIDLETQLASWSKAGKEQSLRVLPEFTYVNPTGYKVRMEKHPNTPAWRLVGTVAEGTLCHKPCTVSGGGKSEISKSLWDAIHFGPVFISDYDKDMAFVEEIINKNYKDRYLDKKPADYISRPVLSDERSLGSVIKLLTPTSDCTKEYNEWVSSIPNYIKALVYTVKRFYRPEWGNNWKEHFGVEIVNGANGNQFMFEGRALSGQYLRVGLRDESSGYTYKLRQDFMPADKVQWEDDISASIILPASELKNLNPEYKNPSVKFAINSENRFFQRPDDAVHRGYDKQAEADLASTNNFICNFEPLPKAQAQEFIEQTIGYHKWTAPMKNTIREVAENYEGDYFVSSAHPRIVNGVPTKNPRYLQTRPDLLDPKPLYLAELGMRLYRQIPVGQAVPTPVNAVLPGRRNNPADHKAGIRPLAVYAPIHYQELPELFMDFVCSLTGKSPSTTGAGSEGALTKGPFNALVATSDLNNALLGFILTGYNAFSSAAGHIGHKYEMAHDVSLFIPELWSRLTEEERDPKMMVEKGYLEKIEDFEYKGEKIHGSRLGYRITRDFTTNYLGRMFDNPEIIFNDEMLQPELQNMDDYVDGIKNIVEAQQKVAKNYTADGSVESAIPPLKAILHIMAEGNYQGKTAEDPEIRKLFDYDYVINSDWYQERLDLQQKKMVALYEKHIDNLKAYTASDLFVKNNDALDIPARLAYAEAELKKFKSAEYRKSLVGTLGADPLAK